jgi:hypothetical protein
MLYSNGSIKRRVRKPQKITIFFCNTDGNPVMFHNHLTIRGKNSCSEYIFHGCEMWGFHDGNYADHWLIDVSEERSASILEVDDGSNSFLRHGSYCVASWTRRQYSLHFMGVYRLITYLIRHVFTVSSKCLPCIQISCVPVTISLAPFVTAIGEVHCVSCGLCKQMSRCVAIPVERLRTLIALAMHGAFSVRLTVMLNNTPC